MSGLIGLLLPGWLKRALAGAGVLMVAIALTFHMGARRGRKRERERIHERDRITADRIRERVELARRVRPGRIVYRD